MAVLPVTIKRGSKTSTRHIGVSPEGKTRYYKESEEVNSAGMPVRKAFLSLLIEADKSEAVGEVFKITTRFWQVPISPNGTPLHDLGKEVSFTTEEMELPQFALAYGNILYSIANGDVRAIEGFNDKPIFNAMGQVIQYTPEQEDEPPFERNHPGSYGYVEPEPEPQNP